MSCCDEHKNFPCKNQLEDVTLEFDFSPSMEPTETIIQIKSVEVDVLAGVDADPNSFKDGSPAIAGQIVRVPVHNGVKGTTYLFTVLVDTSLRDNMVLQGYITVT